MMTIMMKIMMTIMIRIMMTMIPGMWLMLQQDKPDDFVLATGHMHSVREFVEVNIVVIIMLIIIIIITIIIIMLATGHMHSVREFVEVNIVTDVIIVNVLVIIIIMLIMMTRLPVSTLEWSLSGKGAATARSPRRRKLEL